jgi:hypothetical protein
VTADNVEKTGCNVITTIIIIITTFITNITGNRCRTKTTTRERTTVTICQLRQLACSSCDVYLESRYITDITPSISDQLAGFQTRRLFT